MKKRRLFIPLFIVSAMLFVGISLYINAKKHILKVQENVVLNEENYTVKKENCSLKVENVKLKEAVKSLKNEIQLRDSIKQEPKISSHTDKPAYMPYRIFTNQISDTDKGGE